MFSGLIGVRNMDKDYSGGFHIEIFTDFLNLGNYIFWRNRHENRKIAGEYLNYNSIYFQGMGFTPSRDEFAQPQPSPGSRPYASLIGFGFRRIAMWDSSSVKSDFFRKHPIALETDLFVGSIGSSGPGTFQNWIHRNISNSDQVTGWESQIGNGGRPALKYRVQATWQVVETKSKGTKYFFHNPLRAYIRLNSTVGTIFNNFGGAVILSTRDLASTSVNTTLSSNKFDGSSRKRSEPRPLSFEVYFAPQYVGRNSLLEGYPMQDNSVYTIPESEIKTVVFDIGAKVILSGFTPGGKIFDESSSDGVIHRTRGLWYLEFVRRSKEFDTHVSHTFVNLGVTMFFID